MTRRQPLTQHLTDSILYLLITDKDFLGIARQVVPLELFQSRLVERIAGLCYAYFDQFNSAPRGHFQDEFARIAKNIPDEDRDLSIDYAQRLQAMQPPEKDYVFSQLHNFIRSRRLEQSAMEVARAVESGNLDAAERSMLEALKSGVPTFESGLDYMNDKTPMLRRDQNKGPLTSCGIELMDRSLGGGLFRKHFVVVLGKYKGFKTWALVKIGVESCRRGLKVAHISHECTAEEMEERYDQAFGSLHAVRTDSGLPIKEPLEIIVERYDRKKDSFYKDKVVRPSVWDASAVKRARNAIRRFGGGLWIKKYPMGSASMRDIFAWLDFMERFEGVVFDVVINDYADIMASIKENDQTRDAVNQTYIWHKRLADERNSLVLTASQSTRAAIGKDTFSQKDFAEDIRKLGNVDVCIAVAQNLVEEKEGRSNALLLASRSRKAWARVQFGRALEIGQAVTWERYPPSMKAEASEKLRGRTEGRRRGA